MLKKFFKQRHKQINIFLLVLACLLSSFFVSSVYADNLNNTDDNQLTVDVFTLTKLPLPNKQHSLSMTTLPANVIVNVYQIDKIFQLNDQLNRVGVHSFEISGKEAAIATAKAWIEEHRDVYQQFIEGLNKSLQFNIQQVPAIVFSDKFSNKDDNQYVVLGTLDLNLAYESYLDFQRKISFTEKFERKVASRRPA